MARMTSPSSNPKRIKPGLVELLESAAALLESEAIRMHSMHTGSAGRWVSGSVHLKPRHDDLLAVAKGLRAARDYWSPNCLGGPAKVFWAIADQIQAGVPIDDAMADFGVAWSG